MSGANQREAPNPAIVWENSELRIVRKAWGEKLQHCEFIIERRSSDALNAPLWIRDDAVQFGTTLNRKECCFCAVLESLYAERYDKKPEPPAETEKPQVEAFACASLMCQCGWFMTHRTAVWPLILTCANPNCSRFGKRFRAPVMRLECVTEEDAAKMADFHRRMEQFEATRPKVELVPLQTADNPEDGD